MSICLNVWSILENKIGYIFPTHQPSLIVESKYINKLHSEETVSIVPYRILCGRDQREKSDLKFNVIKHTFQANSALLITKSTLTVQ